MNQIRIITIPILCCLLWAGCDKPAPPAPKAQVISQHIQSPKAAPAKAPPSSSQTMVPAVAAPIAPPQAKAPENSLVASIQMKPQTAIGYLPQGRIDPFAPFIRERVPEVAKKKVPNRPLTPLEKFDLDQLKLVGIVRAPTGNLALVEEASGKGYIISVGTYIGTHSGRVVAINKDRIVIQEDVENLLGKVTQEKREMKLQKPPGEQ
jgi:type IV pilus assembly protein PilP